MIENPAFLRGFGITRLGDVTDLDVIGMPVWFATRPNSRGLSVSQGKGMTAGQAKLSAVMEAIEGAVAEDTQRHISEHGSVEEIRRRGHCTLPLETISRVNADLLNPDRERAWVAGRAVRDQKTILAPFELVGLDFRADFPWDRQAFQMSSQGLAAGFDFDHAAQHAILELIENDACMLHEALATRIAASHPVSFARGRSADLDQLVDRLESVALAPHFFDLTGANGVPVILASIPRSVMANAGPGGRAAAGIACRVDAADAACSALQEAIQSRLTYISGARDDLSPKQYDADPSLDRRRSPDGRARECERILALPAGQQDAPIWQRLADHLFSCGVLDLYLFRLETGHPDIVVVRALARGLTAASTSHTKLTVGALHNLLGT